jgi:hypothetical protein
VKAPERRIKFRSSSLSRSSDDATIWPLSKDYLAVEPASRLKQEGSSLAQDRFALLPYSLTKA